MKELTMSEEDDKRTKQLLRDKIVWAVKTPEYPQWIFLLPLESQADKITAIISVEMALRDKMLVNYMPDLEKREVKKTHAWQVDHDLFLNYARRGRIVIRKREN